MTKCWSGTSGHGRGGFPVIPETLGDLISPELDAISTRETDPLALSEPDKKELKEKILPFWRGKSHIERLGALLSPLETSFLFADPPNYYKGTGIMSANPGVYGTGGHLTLDFPTLLNKGFSRDTRRRAGAS